jgi:hypothetical protein
MMYGWEGQHVAPRLGRGGGDTQGAGPVIADTTEVGYVIMESLVTG